MTSESPTEEQTERDAPLASGLWSGLRCGLGVGLLGTVMIVLLCVGGTFLAVKVFGVDFSQAAGSDPRVELSVDEDGCQVTRSEVRGETVGPLRWLVTNLDGDPVHDEAADRDLSFRYFEYGVFEITVQSELDGEFQDISNGVRVFCDPENGG